MSTKSSASRPAQKQAPIEAQLPDGYTPVSAGSFGETWDYEAHNTLTGTVSGPVVEMELGNGKNKRTARFVTIIGADDGVIYTVWDSAALHSFFDVLTDGLEVSIVFRGFVDVGKELPMKSFVGGIRAIPKDA